MDRNEFFRLNAGRYLLTRLEMGGADVSEPYVKGWEDRSLYMYFEITEDGKFRLHAHSGTVDKMYEYYLDPGTMRYHLKADLSDDGIPIEIENGIITEDAEDHLMVYELTDIPD